MTDGDIFEFDWDEGNRAHCRKHGVSIMEIEMLFRSPTLAIRPDLKHSAAEKRFLAIGRNHKGRPIFLAFTLRERGGLTCIRPVSARYMHQEEIEYYEEENS